MLELKIFNPQKNSDGISFDDRVAEQKPRDSEVRLSTSHIGKEGLKRNQWVKIKFAGSTIFRIAKGSNIQGLKQDYIWLSYDSKVELGINKDEDKVLELKRANVFERYILAPWKTPDPVQREIFRIGFLLGLLSVGLGVLSVYISFIN